MVSSSLKHNTKSHCWLHLLKYKKMMWHNKQKMAVHFLEHHDRYKLAGNVLAPYNVSSCPFEDEMPLDCQLFAGFVRNDWWCCILLICVHRRERGPACGWLPCHQRGLVTAPTNGHILVSSTYHFNLLLTPYSFRECRLTKAYHAHRVKLHDTFRQRNQVQDWTKCLALERSVQGGNYNSDTIVCHLFAEINNVWKLQREYYERVLAVRKFFIWM